MAENPRESNGTGKTDHLYYLTKEHGFTVEEAKAHVASTPVGNRFKPADITLCLDVDVSDALTGLKALRREADATVRSLKALEDTLGNVSIRHMRVGDIEQTEIIRPEVSE